MPKLSKQAFEERRANIMDAARRCFARDGIHVSVDGLCAEAGVSKGALYGYFPSKEAIIQAIADEHVADLEDIRKASGPDALLASLLERVSYRDPLQSRLELEAWAYSLNNASLHRRLRDNTERLRLVIEEALTAMVASGKLVLKLSPASAALLLETYAVGMVACTALGQGETDAERRKCLDVAFDALISERT
jgi:AcrR family transcriptional regulator